MLQIYVQYVISKLPDYSPRFMFFSRGIFWTFRSYYIKFYASSYCSLSISTVPCSVSPHWIQSPEVCIAGFQEQYYILKPNEASTRLFYLHASTDQAAKYQCTGGLKLAGQFSISVLTMLLC